MATLPGVRLYAAHGYAAGETVTHDAGGVPVEFVPMRKELEDDDERGMMNDE